LTAARVELGSQHSSAEMPPKRKRSLPRADIGWLGEMEATHFPGCENLAGVLKC
jgi:hypothetical protein